MAGGRLVLRRNTFQDNTADRSGGGVVTLGEGHVLGCSFQRNRVTTGDGGAVQVGNGGFLRVFQSSFELNIAASGLGGGVSVVNGNTEMTECSFRGNATGTAGNATRTEQDSLLMRVWDGSETPHAVSGGGVYLSESSGDYSYMVAQSSPTRRWEWDAGIRRNVEVFEWTESPQWEYGVGSSFKNCTFQGLKSFTGGGLCVQQHARVCTCACEHVGM